LPVTPTLALTSGAT
ncbi:hypothetical protein, partial [Enterobacter chuandaensis]